MGETWVRAVGTRTFVRIGLIITSAARDANWGNPRWSADEARTGALRFSRAIAKYSTLLNYFGSALDWAKTRLHLPHGGPLLGGVDRLGAERGEARLLGLLHHRGVGEGRLRRARRAGAGDEDHQSRHRDRQLLLAHSDAARHERAQHPRPVRRPLRSVRPGRGRHRLHAAGPRHSGREAAGASEGECGDRAGAADAKEVLVRRAVVQAAGLPPSRRADRGSSTSHLARRPWSEDGTHGRRGGGWRDRELANG